MIFSFLKKLLCFFVTEVYQLRYKAHLWFKLRAKENLHRMIEGKSRDEIENLRKELDKLKESHSRWVKAWHEQRVMTGSAYWQGVKDAFLRPNITGYLPSLNEEIERRKS